MRYWTYFYIGGDEGAYSGDSNEYSIRRYFFDIIKPGRESRSPTSNIPAAIRDGEAAGLKGATAFALVDPTHEDLLALGNAAIYDPSRHEHEVEQEKSKTSYYYPGLVLSGRVRLVIRPQDFDNELLYLRETCPEKQVRWRYTSRDINTVLCEDFTIIRDGEVVDSICEDCSYVIGRAAGKCEPPVKGCRNKLFGDREITPPSTELFMDHKECIPHEAFKICTPSRMALDVTPGSPIDRADPATNTAAAAGITRSLRATFCSQCSLSFEKGKSYRCGDGYLMPDERRCCGPVFTSEFPEPAMLTRQLMRLTKRHIPLSLFREIEKESYKERKDFPFHCNYSNWRKDPELMIGWYDKAKNNINIYQDRVSGKSRYACSINVADFKEFAERYDYELPEIVSECSDLERAIGFVIESGLVNMNFNRNYGFANAAAVNFSRCVKYGDYFEMYYTFASFNEGHTIRNIADLGILYPRVCEAAGTLTSKTDPSKSVLARKHELHEKFNDARSDKTKMRQLKKEVEEFRKACTGEACQSS